MFKLAFLIFNVGLLAAGSFYFSNKNKNKNLTLFNQSNKQNSSTQNDVTLKDLNHDNILEFLKLRENAQIVANNLAKKFIKAKFEKDFQKIVDKINLSFVNDFDLSLYAGSKDDYSKHKALNTLLLDVLLPDLVNKWSVNLNNAEKTENLDLPYPLNFNYLNHKPSHVSFGKTDNLFKNLWNYIFEDWYKKEKPMLYKEFAFDTKYECPLLNMPINKKQNFKITYQSSTLLGKTNEEKAINIMSEKDTTNIDFIHANSTPICLIKNDFYPFKQTKKNSKSTNISFLGASYIANNQRHILYTRKNINEGELIYYALSNKINDFNLEKTLENHFKKNYAYILLNKFKDDITCTKEKQLCEELIKLFDNKNSNLTSYKSAIDSAFKSVQIIQKIYLNKITSHIKDNELLENIMLEIFQNKSNKHRFLDFVNKKKQNGTTTTPTNNLETLWYDFEKFQYKDLTNDKIKNIFSAIYSSESADLKTTNNDWQKKLIEEIVLVNNAHSDYHNPANTDNSRTTFINNLKKNEKNKFTKKDSIERISFINQMNTIFWLIKNKFWNYRQYLLNEDFADNFALWIYDSTHKGLITFDTLNNIDKTKLESYKTNTDKCKYTLIKDLNENIFDNCENKDSLYAIFRHIAIIAKDTKLQSLANPDDTISQTDWRFYI